ncbi:MAG: hypothetical protein KKB20_11510 [Proteobacteria bacterium]|nr:hypothetical protein [Pseudomonadota bacterium]
MPESLYFDLSPTQHEFVMSDAHLVQLMGPMGEGKTFASVAGLIAHAARCGKGIRTALVRDTFQNIKTSTIPDLRDYLGAWIRFYDGEKKATILSNPRVELDFFGIDDEASISKLQGPQYAAIWLEEPAPIYEKANAGLPREVFNMAVARAARQRETVPRVQISQNPSDEDHWTSELADEPDGVYASYEDPDTGEVSEIIKKTFWIAPGENKRLSGLARASNIAAFKNDPAKYARYVEGKTAEVTRGKKVTPGYNEKIHYSRHVLPVLPGEAFMFWDSWQHPTCVLAQYTARGQLIVHDIVLDSGLGTKELVEEQLEPFLRTMKWKDKIKTWRLIGDFSMRIPDQSSVRSSAAKYLEKKFGVRFEPGPGRWTTIREHLNYCFKRLINEGEPAVLLSRSAVKLHKALKGGWHYKVDNSGRIMGDKPVKNQHSHPGDAFANGISVLMPYQGIADVPKVSREKNMQAAMSYRGGNYSRGRRQSGGR